MHPLPPIPPGALQRTGPNNQLAELASALANVHGRIAVLEVLTSHVAELRSKGERRLPGVRHIHPHDAGGRQSNEAALHNEMAALHEQRASLRHIVGELAGGAHIEPQRPDIRSVHRHGDAC